MRQIEDYYKKDSLQVTRDALADPTLSFSADRDRVNELVMNLVVNYLAEYLGVGGSDVGKIREVAKDRIRGVDRSEFEMLVELSAATGDTPVLGDKEALDCLSDIRATSAIVKEIMFNDKFAKDGDFLGVDLGCGTGILLVALAIAARRNKINNILLYGIDNQAQAIENARRTLETALGGFGVSSLELVVGDVLDPRIIADVTGRGVRYLVSETFGLDTRPLDDFAPSGHGENVIDPFHDMMIRYGSADPDFGAKVKQRNSAMFPDAFNGLYVPDGERSTLLLETASEVRPVKLWDVGKEFVGYEGLGLKAKRWREPEHTVFGRPMSEVIVGAMRRYERAGQSSEAVRFGDFGFSKLIDGGGYPIMYTVVVFHRGQRIGTLNQYDGEMRKDYWGGGFDYQMNGEQKALINQALDLIEKVDHQLHK